MLSKDIFLEIIKKLPNEDFETFKSLADVSEQSKKVAVIVSEQKYREYLNSEIYVYWKANGEWKISMIRPTSSEIDPMGNSRLVFKYKMGDLLELIRTKQNIIDLSKL